MKKVKFSKNVLAPIKDKLSFDMESVAPLYELDVLSDYCIFEEKVSKKDIIEHLCGVLGLKRDSFTICN